MRALLALLVVCAVLAGCNRRVDPVATEAEARTLLAQGKGGEARILLKNALARNPSFTRARVLLAGIAMDEGNPKAARDELSVADAEVLQSPEAIALRVHVALALGDVDEADRLMRVSGSVIPEPERTVLQSGVQLAAGAAPEALALLRERQRGSPADPQLAIAIASTLAAMGNLTPAIEELDRYLEPQPVDRSDALKVRGELHLRQGAPERASEDFADAIKAAPDSWPRISRLTTELMVGDALLATGDIPAAKEQIRRIERTWPGMQGTELLQAQVALFEGRSGEAAGRLAAIAESNPDNVRLQYLLIDALVKSGNITRATELLEQRVAAEPGTVAARNALADLYMQQGRPDRVIDLLGETVDEDILDTDESGELLASARVAREEAQAAIKTLTAKLRESPGDIRLLAELATAQTANGDPASALVSLGAMPLRGWIPESAAARMAALIAMNNEFESNRLVDRLLDPASATDPAVLVAAADVAYRARQNANVSRLLDRAAQLDPGNTDIQLRRASLAFDERRFAEAEKMLRPLATGGKASLPAQVALARVVEAQGDLAQARAILGTAIAGNPGEPEPGLRLAAMELRASQPAAAAEVLNRMIASAKGGEGANAAGMMLADENRFDEARTRFRQAVDREPDDARFWFNLGQTQLVLNDPAAASESFTQAAALEPGSLPIVLAAVRTALARHNGPSARRSIDALALELPDDPVTQLLLGDVAMNEGKAQQAEVAYAKSFGLRPSSLAAIGEYHARVRLDTPRAVEPLLRWLAREPEDSEARHLLADYYLGHGQDEAALVHLEILIRQTPNDVVALNNLAWLLRDVDKARAEQLAVQASAIAPDNPAVADTLGTILLANGKVAEALATLKKAAIALPDDKSVQGHYAEALRRVEDLR